MTMIADNKLKASELDQFTGTEQYYKHWLGMRYTDGVKYVAERANAYWLLDAIASYQRGKIATMPFQVWELTTALTFNKSNLSMKEDTNEPVVVNQHIEYTDFPIAYIKMYFIEGVLLLPSEY
jgi:hypothetical protein